MNDCIFIQSHKFLPLSFDIIIKLIYFLILNILDLYHRISLVSYYWILMINILFKFCQS